MASSYLPSLQSFFSVCLLLSLLKTTVLKAQVDNPDAFILKSLTASEKPFPKRATFPGSRGWDESSEIEATGQPAAEDPHLQVASAYLT